MASEGEGRRSVPVLARNLRGGVSNEGRERIATYSHGRKTLADVRQARESFVHGRLLRALCSTLSGRRAGRGDARTGEGVHVLRQRVAQVNRDDGGRRFARTQTEIIACASQSQRDRGGGTAVSPTNPAWRWTCA